MQNQKKAGQAEDWELSEEYYREDTGKKELRLEDFLEEEPAETDREGLAGADGLKEQLESMADRVKQIRELSAGTRPIRLLPCLAWTDSRSGISWCACSPSRRMIHWR